MNLERPGQETRRLVPAARQLAYDHERDVRIVADRDVKGRIAASFPPKTTWLSRDFGRQTP